MEDFVKVYDNSQQVNSYIKEKDLQKPEQTILNKYFEKIKNSVLLDVGIGTGRTTYHLSGIAKKYVGVDISQGMINGANENFRNQNLDFKVCDARNMSIFDDNTFDVVFFSFNGIDHIEIDERILFFNEVKRISKKDALLVFSTHNIQNIPKLMRLKWSSHPIIFYENFLKEEEVYSRKFYGGRWVVMVVICRFINQVYDKLNEKEDKKQEGDGPSSDTKTTSPKKNKDS